MRIPQPFLPVTVESENLCHRVRVVGREYTFGPDGMLISVKSEGCELLAAPMRLVCVEDGQESVFDRDYAHNESESFIQRRSDEEAVICGCMQTKRFILNVCNTVDYDGNVDVDLKFVTKGETVAEHLGFVGMKPVQYLLDHMWLEIPMKRELFTLYHMHPNSDVRLADGTVVEKTTTTASGKLHDQSFDMPFRALYWMGNEELGLGWFAENERNWQPEREDKVMQVIYDGDKVILRARLLDSHPKAWTGDPARGWQLYNPIDFHYGFHATPVKPFPKNPYVHKAYHVDIAVKIKGNYMDFLTTERFDRLQEKGVDTLFLHEKWNKSQNWFELSEYTGKQLRYIVDEAHKRGMKVLPYFGYEISSLSPVWSELQKTVTMKTKEGLNGSGWWRVPFQRDYIACYNSEYADYFIDGIANIMDTYNIDGVYLDGTAYPRHCHNVEHGCGWYDPEGNLRGSYPIKAIRRLFKRLHKVVKSRGGHINVHTFGVANFTAQPYIDQNWYGETLQFDLIAGKVKEVNLDFFRAEYTGRNMGVPVEFIAYENRPVWTFEHALSCASIHGILPRVNDIDFPLELMSKVWKIIGNFPVEQAQWKPYWNNGAESDHEKVKVSYYKYTALDGQQQMLVFVANTAVEPIESTTIRLNEKISTVINAETGESASLTVDLNPFGYKILFMR